MTQALAAAILLAAVLWTIDWLALRYKVMREADAFGEVEVHYRFAVHLKNKRIEQEPEKSRTEECVHALFPHYDESPCWYLERHAHRLEDVNSAPWHFYYDE